MKRLVCLLLALLLIPLYTGAELPAWTCPGCGQEGNTRNYCPNCGTARPAQEDPEPELNENLTQIPGETDRVKVNILRIDGSGYVAGKKDKYLYAPEKAIDEDESTCWQFSAKNVQKKNAWLWMVIEGETIDEIWIRNGFQAFDSKGKYQYPVYARLKDIRVVFTYAEEGSEPDEMEFTLTDENGGEWEKLDTGRHENVYDVVVYISSIYKGKSQKTNACLSEIMLVQNAPSETAYPSWRHQD